MPDEIYEVVAQGARYWFLFLMALIVWRSYRWFARDRKQRRKRLKLLPDAGFVGELVVQAGNTELPPGLALPVAREGVLGSVRGADVYAPIGGVAKKHLWFEYDAENGLYVEPYGHHSADVDGQPLLGWRTHAYLAHGSRLTVGNAVLRLRMFAGFEQAGIKGAAGLAFAEDAANADTQQLAAMQAQWAAWQAAQAAAGTPQTQPAATPTLDTQQLAAMQAQWAAWQAAQAAAGVPQTQPARSAAAQPVLATAAGAFVAPPRVTAPKPILANTVTAPHNADDISEPFEALQPHTARHHRINALPLFGDTEPDAYPHTPGMLATQGEPFAEPDPTFAPLSTFYPPVMDDAQADAPDAGNPAQAIPDEDMVESWPYSAFPQSDAHFVPSGNPYPEHVAPDVPYEYADEDEAPRNLYVEPDEAEKAKRLLWDRYLKGGGH